MSPKPEKSVGARSAISTLKPSIAAKQALDSTKENSSQAPSEAHSVVVSDKVWQAKSVEIIIEQPDVELEH